jgi:acyl-coenzyme A synthetase/AMP-(fatty) acid ligase
MRPSLDVLSVLQELHRKVCQCANAMKAQGVKKGDVVMVSAATKTFPAPPQVPC